MYQCATRLFKSMPQPIASAEFIDRAALSSSPSRFRPTRGLSSASGRVVTVLAGALLSAFLITPASAQDACDAVLKQGVFNLTTVNSQKSVQDNLYEWLKTTTWSSFQQAQSGGLTLGFPIKGIPFSLSASYTQSDFQQWQQAVDQGKIENFTSEEFLQIVQRSVSVDLVNAWLECIKSTSGVGLSCSHTVNGDLGIIFSFRYAPNSTGDIPPIVAPYGWQVTGASVPNGFGPGSEIPIGGASIILTRTSATTAVNIVLNTTKGSCTRFVPGAKPTDPGPQMPAFVLKTFTATSAQASHPEVRLTVPAGYKIISGGCRDNYTGYGNMLTACYPEDQTTWVGRGKDHTIGDPATLDVFVIAVYDPKDEWIVYMQSSTSAPSGVPNITATLPQGYALTGGGAVVNYSGWGQLLTASYPEGIRSWTAKAKQHGPADAAPVTSIAIGIAPRNGFSMPVPVIFQQRSTVASHPGTSISVDSGYTMTGGGAFADWHTNGSLLVSSFPSDASTWTVSSKDHLPPGEATSIVAYAIGIKFVPKTCQFLVGPDQLNFAAAAGSANISVQADNGCGFSVASGDYWIRLDPKGQLTSSVQLINVSVDQNTTGASRSGSIAVAGRTITVTQETAPVCGPFSVRLSTLQFDASGGTATADISGQSSCFWTAQTPADFVTFRPSSGQGSGSITIMVGANRTNAVRTAVLSIGGSTLQITQAGVQVCGVFTVQLSNNRFTASGGTATADISGSPGCPWTAQSDATFVTFTTASGQGAAKISFTVSANSSASARTAFLTIAGTGKLQISQDGTQNPPPAPADPDASRLAGTTQALKWFYIMSSQQRWYIVRENSNGQAGTPGVNASASVLLLQAVDPTVAGGIVWKPISNFDKVGSLPAAPVNFASVSVAADGRSITFGSLSTNSTDSDIASLANTTQPVRWFYISTDSDQNWYIVQGTPTNDPAVLFLKAVDPAVAGGIRWKPLHNAPAFADFPAAGERYQSVVVSSDGRRISFGQLQ
jgi:Putative binding domain, N-terminal/Viral BACON domain